MPRSKKGLGRCHKNGIRNNQGRRITTPCDNRGFNRNDCHSKSIEMSLPLILVSNPPQMYSIYQQSSRSSPNSHHDNKWLDSNHINSKSNDLLSPGIPTLPPWNFPFINPTQLFMVRQQSYSSSPNTTHDLQASSLPGWTSPDLSNTMPPPSTKNGSRNVYVCMVAVSK